MSGSGPAVKPYDGTLVLKDVTQESYLKDGNGETFLLMLDPTSSGDDSPARVVAAWTYYRANNANGAAISVQGFETTPSYLHVVVP